MLEKSKKKEVKLNEEQRKKILEELISRNVENRPYMEELCKKISESVEPSIGTYMKILNMNQDGSLYGDDLDSILELEDSKGEIKPKMTLDHYYNVAVK